MFQFNSKKCHPKCPTKRLPVNFEQGSGLSGLLRGVRLMGFFFKLNLRSIANPKLTNLNWICAKIGRHISIKLCEQSIAENKQLKNRLTPRLIEPESASGLTS